jgi:hypothetical protein
MSQRVDTSAFYTKRQSKSLFVQRPQAPQPPTSLAATGSGVLTNNLEQTAYVDLTLTDPSTPSWANAPQYVQAYEFAVSYSVGAGTETRRFLLTHFTSYRLTPLPPGASLSIVARTIDYLGQASVNSSILSTSTPADSVAPAAPSIIATGVSAGAQINIAVLNSEYDFDHYDLYRGRGPDSAHVTWESAVVEKFFGTVVVDQAIPVSASDYFYQVKAVDLSGNTSSSNISGPLSLVSSGIAVPNTPDMTGATATPNVSGSVTFHFLANTDATLYAYRIWRRVHGVAAWTLLETIQSSPGSPGTYIDYVDTKTVTGTNYDYIVTAENSAHDESGFPGSFVSATAADTQSPSSPSSLTATGVTGGVQISWLPSSSTDVAGYQVTYRLTSLSSFSSPVLVQGTQFVLYGLTQTRDSLANQLEFNVAAQDTSGNLSSVADLAVDFPSLAGYRPADNTVPPAPDPISVSMNDDGSATLSWTAPSISDLAGFQVEQWDTISQIWDILSRWQDSVSGAKSFLAPGLEPYSFRNRQYRFRVRTLDNSGNISNINLLDNSGFEYGTISSWSIQGGGTTTLLSTGAFSGTYCVKLNNLGLIHQDNVPVTVGLSYAFSAYAKEDPSSTGGIAKVKLSWINGSSGVISSQVAQVTTNSSYQRIPVIGVAPVGAVTATLTLLGDDGNTSKTVIYDAAQFEQSLAVTSYADGKTANQNAIVTSGPPDYSGTLGLVASAQLGQIALRWNNPTTSLTGFYSYINGYFEIWRATNSGFTTGVKKIAERAAFVDGASNGFDDTDPDENVHTTFWYKLKARDRFGNESGYLNAGASVTATSLTPNDVSIVSSNGATIPAAPINSGATTTLITNGVEVYSEITVTLTDPSTPSWCSSVPRYVQGYYATYTYTSQSIVTTKNRYFAHTSDNKYTFSNLIPGDSYTIKFFTVDFLSQQSTSFLTVTQTASADSTAPAQPTFTASATSGGVLINITGIVGTPNVINTEPDFSFYAVYHATTIGGTYSLAGKFYGDHYTDASASSGTYYYAVVAFDFSGNQSTATGSFSTIAQGPVTTVTTGADSPPVTPGGLSVSTGSYVDSTGAVITFVASSWTANTEGGLVGYKLRIRKTGDSDYNYVYVDSSSTNARFQPLPANTSFGVSIASVHQLGAMSSYSSEQSVTTSVNSSAPNTVSSLNAVAGFRVISLTWTSVSNTDVAGYIVKRSSDNITFNTIATIKTNYFIDGGDSSLGKLDISTTYYYKVAAINTSSVSGSLSSVASATTAAVGDSDVVANTISGNKIVSNSITATQINVTDLIGSGINSVGNTTLIAPGKIQLVSTTTLQSWMFGGNTTAIDGGKIQANTVSANSITIGARGVNVNGIVFVPKAISLTSAVSSTGSQTVNVSSFQTGYIGIGSQITVGMGKSNQEVVVVTAFTSSSFTAVFANTHTTGEVALVRQPTTDPLSIAWSAGSVEFQPNSGSSMISVSVNGGAATYSSGNLYLYWVYTETSPSTISSTTTSATAYASTNLVLAAYAGGALIFDFYGKTSIDGSFINTGSIKAGSIAANTITANEIAAATITATQIAAGTITSDKLNASGISAGGSSGMPGQIVVYDNLSTIVGYIGAFSSTFGGGSNVYGGWFKTLGVGGNVNSPSLYIDGSGNLKITSAAGIFGVSTTAISLGSVHDRVSVTIGTSTSTGLNNVLDGPDYFRNKYGANLPADLPYNAGFEIFPDTVTIADGWSYFGNANGVGSTSRSTSPKAGTYAQILTSVAGGGYDLCSRPFAVKGNVRYTFRTWVKADVASANNVNFRAIWFSDDSDLSLTSASLIQQDQIVADGTLTSGTSNTFTLYEGEVLAPSTAKFCRIDLWNKSNGTSTVNLTFDVLSVRPSKYSLADGAIADNNLEYISDSTNFYRNRNGITLPADLPYNGGFEIFPDGLTIADGWTPNFEVTGSGYSSARSTTSFNGTYAQSLTNNGASGGLAIASRPMSVKPSIRYKFRVRARSTAANPGSMYFRVLYYTNDDDLGRGGSLTTLTPTGSPGGAFVGGFDIVSAGGPTSANVYQLFEGEVLTPSDAKFCRIILYNWLGTSNTMLFDTVSAGLATLSLADGGIGGTQDNLIDGPNFGRGILGGYGGNGPNSRINGFAVNDNPDFINGLTRYTVYDNNATGHVSLSLVSDATAPNGSGQKMRITTSAGGESPGWGGFFLGFNVDSGTIAPFSYHKGDTLIYRIIANIPSGFSINFTSNATGTGATNTWLTGTAGTGAWATYILKSTIGTSGTFSSTGFFYTTGTGSPPSTWDVAICEVVDIDQAHRYGVASIDVNFKAVIDFSSGHSNKDTDHIGDATGSPLAGGKRGFLALTASFNLVSGSKIGGDSGVGCSGQVLTTADIYIQNAGTTKVHVNNTSGHHWSVASV